MADEKKLFVQVTGSFELSWEYLADAVKDLILRDYGFPIKRLEYNRKTGGVTAIVEYEEGKPLVNSRELNWPGLYAAIGLIVDSYRSKKKKFITFDDLLKELHQMKDDLGRQLFIKGNGVKLPMTVLRHRLAPSQLIRQAKGQKNLQNIKNDKFNGGLRL